MSMAPRTSEFFVAGGTLRSNTPSYIKRPADDELFSLALAGEFCYVLAARQMGKSSLMIRAARRLSTEGIRTAIIDLTEIGAVADKEWYLGLLTELSRALRLPIDPEAWWQERRSLGSVQRFTNFLRDVVLTEIEEQVVIFIDEIDTTLSLDFSDDFFAAIRATYNARAKDARFNRLTFVLLGVAAPFDLIKDRTRTPFNIGQGIALNDFSRTDAVVLQTGLEAVYPGQGEVIFSRIYHWTSGHPYLTQKLCLTTAETSSEQWTNGQVDQLVKGLFLTEKARKETNLQYVRENILASPQRRSLLKIYRQVLTGNTVSEDERSLDQNRLKLLGLIRAENGVLKVRNEICRQVFNLDWIKASTPVDWARRIAVSATLIAVVLVAILGVYTWQQGQQEDEVLAQAYEDSFNGTTNPTLRLDNLANLFGLPGYGDRARALFGSLSPYEKIALFASTTSDLQPQVRTVITGVYTSLSDTESDNVLLRAMQAALDQSDEAESVILGKEITQWLAARAAAREGGDKDAKLAYSIAIELNEQNPATHFERTLVLVAMQDYEDALADLETTLVLNKDWQEQVQQLMENSGPLYTTLWRSQGDYPTLVAFVPTPTNTPTSTATATNAPTATPTAEPKAKPTGVPTDELTTKSDPAVGTSTPIIIVVTPTDTPTTPLPSYSQPQLVSPPNLDRASGLGYFTGRAQQPRLEWESVGELGPNDFYVVTVSFSAFGSTVFDGASVKDAFWDVDRRLFDTASEDKDFTWLVTVSHFEDSTINAQGIPEPVGEGVEVSPRSEARVFRWD